MKPLLFLLLFAAPALADEPKAPAPPAGPSVTMPDAVTAKPGRYCHVKITYVGDDCKYWVDGSADALDVFREYDPTPNTLAICVGGDQGVYYLHAIAASATGGKAVLSSVGTTAVTLGTPPPGPGPGPGPNPPSNLTAKFQAAYTADGPDAAGLASLVSLYKVAAAGLPANTSLHSNADAIAWVKNAEPGVGLKPSQLPALRKAIGQELDAVMGGVDVPLDVNKAVSEFQKVAQALSGVK